MPTSNYLIIGGGMAGDAAVQGIREVDSVGSIDVIGAEPHRPYNRPPLSKALWKGEPTDSIWRPAHGDGVTFHFGRTARQLDPATRQVTDDQGTVYAYEKLLLATGGSPRRLSFGDDQIIYFRTLDDFERLRALASPKRRVVVIGGGFIGSEIAAALATNGVSVTMVFPSRGIGSRMFPPKLSSFLNDYYRERGIDVLTGTEAIGLEVREGRSVLTIRDIATKGQREISADSIVAGIGIEPDIELARSAGLAVENGIHVDDSLRTSDANIFAAGDVANFYNPALDGRLRVEHEDNANTMGRLAGRAMAGAQVTYDHLPFFYSDLFDLGYEAVGETDSRLETFADWKEPFREGVVYYLRDGRVRGVLLWNVWEQVDAARSLIAERGPFRPEDLKGRLPA